MNLQNVRSLVALIAASCLLLQAQQVGQNTVPGQSAATFTATTQLVIEIVNVKDKDGKPVEGLKVTDFNVTEDGAPQVVKFFEYQKFAEEAAAPAPALQTAAAPFATLTRTQIQSETPGEMKYRDRRLLALYFDMTAMQQPDQLRSLAAADKFVRTQMTPADLMAVMIFTNGSVQVVQDFTGDRDLLTRVIQTLQVGEDDQAAGGTNDGAAAADTGAAFGQNDAEFNIFFTDRQLSALQTAASMLGRLSEKKALIYFASGLRLNGSNNQAQLTATTNAAIKAGVQLWPIDARGLVATAPMGDASRSGPGGAGMYNGQAAQAMMSNFQKSQDTLWTLAADTGGKALLDFNDLTRGITQAQESFTSYYLLGYYTTNTNPDGKLRKVKVTLNGGLSYALDYRQGYYANKQFNKYTQADKERQLEDALMLGDPITELTIATEINYFQLNNAEYFVPLSVKIPGSELTRARRGGAERTTIDFIGEVKDEYGTTMANVRDKIELKLTDVTAAELGRRPIQYGTGFTLLPAKYRLKILARDLETGRIGTYQANFTVPNLTKELKRIPISSVVLSSQRQDLKEALFTAKDKAGAINVDPLVQDGMRLVPSVTRVFSSSKDMYVYLQAYEHGQETVQPLLAFVTFYRGDVKAFETPPVEVRDAVNNRIKTVPLKFSFPLERLAGGEYTCQITVLDPKSHKAAFWQAPVMIVQ